MPVCWPEGSQTGCLFYLPANSNIPFNLCRAFFTFTSRFLPTFSLLCMATCQPFSWENNRICHVIAVVVCGAGYLWKLASLFGFILNSPLLLSYQTLKGYYQIFVLKRSLVVGENLLDQLATCCHEHLLELIVDNCVYFNSLNSTALNYPSESDTNVVGINKFCVSWRKLNDDQMSWTQIDEANDWLSWWYCWWQSFVIGSLCLVLGKRKQI